MSDLISRQEAIDAIAYATFNFTISGKRGFQNYKEEFEKASFAIRDKYIEALKALPFAQPRWIPVEERLPEVGESVLVTFSLIEKYSWVKIARYGTPLYDEHNVCFFESDSEWGDYEISGVTAWMPLPKPYERSEDGRR